MIARHPARILVRILASPRFPLGANPVTTTLVLLGPVVIAILLAGVVA